jgi:hypothetical protein
VGEIVCSNIKDKEELTRRKEMMEKWGKRSERNNGKANKITKVQEKK